MSFNSGKTLSSEVRHMFDEFEFAVWQPVLCNAPFRRPDPVLFARQLSEWLGVGVQACGLPIAVPIREPARMGRSWRLASHRPGQSALSDCSLVGQVAHIQRAGFEFVIGPIPRNDWDCWRNADWFEGSDQAARAGAKLKLLADCLLLVEMIRAWTVIIEPDQDLFVLGHSRSGQAYLQRSTSHSIAVNR